MTGLCRWLPRLCGCHCRADRSFFWRGRQFPVCARCTGELAGMAGGLLLCAFWRPPLWLTLALMVPMIVDGLLQALTDYESVNRRRLVTGLLFGWGLVGFLRVTGELFYRLGYTVMG